MDPVFELFGIPLAVMIYACFADARASAWTEIILRPFASMASCLVLPSEAIGLATVYVCGIALLLSVLNNGQYLLFTFPQTLVLQAVLVTGLIAGATTLSPEPEFGAVLLAVALDPLFLSSDRDRVSNWGTCLGTGRINLPPVIGIAGLWIARVGQEWLERVLP